MALFAVYFNTLLNHEGGFVDNKHDQGGATNKGVILTTWQRYGRDLDNDGDIDVQDLRLISNKDAYNIYKKYFWDSVKGDQIISQHLANILFDMYVNAPSVAVTMLKYILNTQFGCKLAITSSMDTQTLSVLNKMDVASLHDAYKKGRVIYYGYRANYIMPAENWIKFFKMLGINPKDSQITFLKGWMNRVSEFPDLLKKKETV